LDFYGVGIYIIIVAVAALFDAFIILLMARSMVSKRPYQGKLAPEGEEERLPRRKLVQQLRKPQIEPSSPEVEPEPMLVSEVVPTNTPQTEATTPEVSPEAFDEKEEKSSPDDVLSLFRVEEVEDTGLFALAESLEDVDIHSLIREAKEVLKLGGH